MTGVNGHDNAFEPSRYHCPVHGVVEHAITSSIPGHEGLWCQLCWIAALDQIGVKRVTQMKTD